MTKQQLILLLATALMLNACSDNLHKQIPKNIEQKNYVEEYHQLQEARYEEYLNTMAG